MNRLTKTFAILGGAVMMIAAIALSWHVHTASTDATIDTAEDFNVALAQALGNAMRGRIIELMAHPHEPGAYPSLADFHNDIVEQLRGLHIAKVKIYDSLGITVFSTEEKQIGENKSANAGFRRAIAGDVASELTFRDKFSAFEGVIESRNLLSSYIPLRQRNGVVTGVFEVYQDVTELLDALKVRQQTETATIVGGFAVAYLLLLLVVRWAEIQVRNHHEQSIRLAADAARAESANRTKTEFLATMSHELRTPLNAILGFSDMIHGEVLGPNGNPRYREYAGDIHASANHLLDIINDILDMARIEAGKVEIDPVPVGLQRFSDWVQTMVRTQAEAGNVVLRARVDASIMDFVTDERILRQIALNLLTNAIKFTPTGGTVTFTLSAAVAGKLAIIVEDTGVGMRPEDIPRALAPFSQLENTLSRKHRGTGLGLSLANRFVGLLGGQLAISSSPGKGTRVTVTLPTKTAAALSAAA